MAYSGNITGVAQARSEPNVLFGRKFDGETFINFLSLIGLPGGTLKGDGLPKNCGN